MAFDLSYCNSATVPIPCDGIGTCRPPTDPPLNVSNVSPSSSPSALALVPGTCDCLYYYDDDYLCSKTFFYTWGDSGFAYGGVRSFTFPQLSFTKESPPSRPVWPPVGQDSSEIAHLEERIIENRYFSPTGTNGVSSGIPHIPPLGK